MAIEVGTFEAPDHWASALVNGDQSGLDPWDIADMLAWLESIAPWRIVSCDGDSFFGRFDFPTRGRLGTGLLEYIGHKAT